MEQRAAYLRILNGPHKGGVFVLRELSVFEIGQGNGCQIVLDDERVCFNHARIYRKGTTWTFFDLNSEHGSSINDIPVDRRELEGGEIIRVGTTEMHFSFNPPTKKNDSPGQAAPEAAAPEVAPAPAQPAPQFEAPAPQFEAPAPQEVSPQIVSPQIEAPAPQFDAPPAPQFETPLESAARAVPTPGVFGSNPGDVDRLFSGINETPTAGAEAPPAPAEPSEPSEPAVRLKVIDGVGNDIGKELRLDPNLDYVLGRSENCNLVLSDGKVSRLHCRVEYDGNGFLLTDLNSANGTIVNGDRITHARLKLGDYLRLGFTVLAYEKVPVEV